MKKILPIIFCLVIGKSFGQKHWTIPDFAVVQYAGSIGYMSAGFGYNILKSNARFSTHYGFVPQRFGGELQVLSAKLMFVPAKITVWNRVRVNPFDLGLMASYHYGKDVESPSSERHASEYYWWHPAFRGHLVMESSATYEFKKGQRFTSITGYVEFNTNELYFFSFIRNIRSVQVADVVKVGTGVRLQF